MTTEVPLMRLKRDPSAAHQFGWYWRAGRNDPEQDLSRDGELHVDRNSCDSFTYPWVEGECPISPERILDLIRHCEASLWINQLVCPIAWRVYFAYLRSVKNQSGLSDVVWGGHPGRLIRELNSFQPCFCHGDLTVSNVVWTGERFILIDPGHPRGASCREQDEAKLMQSIEETRHCFDRSSPVTAWYEEKMSSLAHRFLLAAHYLRMLRHEDRHPFERIAHARERFHHLINRL